MVASAWAMCEPESYVQMHQAFGATEPVVGGGELAFPPCALQTPDPTAAFLAMPELVVRERGVSVASWEEGGFATSVEAREELLM
jgi:hypothetical protein